MESVSTDIVIIEDTTSKEKSHESSGTCSTEETLLSDRETRDLLLNDLVEGQSFIKRRIQELKASEQAAFNTYEEISKPTILQTNDNIEFLASVERDLDQAYQQLTTKRLYMLLNLKHNPM